MTKIIKTKSNFGKMAITKILLLIIFFVVTHKAICQINKFDPITVGDTLPSVTLTHVINYQYKTLQVSNLKGRLILLDFWNRGCSACISEFPKMQKLQEKFDGQLQIIAVTNDSMNHLQGLFQKSTIIKNTKLTLAIRDTSLHDLFPHGFVPYHVWIDKEGIVKAITFNYNATEKHVEQLLRGENLNLLQANSNADYTSKKTLLSQITQKQLREIKYYSLLTQNINTSQTYSSSIIDSISRDIIGCSIGNVSILDLYRAAFNVPKHAGIVLDLPDSETYFEPSNPNEIDAWRLKNIFSFEVVHPLPTIPPSIRMKEWIEKTLRKDLEYFFKIEGRIETRNVKCLVLRRTSTKDKIASQYKFWLKDSVVYERGNVHIIKHCPLKFLITEVVISVNGRYPVFDESNYSNPVDMELSGDYSNIRNLNKELAKYDLKFYVEDRRINILVLKPKWK